uniref:Thrombospondin, type I, domain containing 1 n=1 Tax=Oryzias latipes TaxID=8090 RepID=A0A3P9M4E2_ORYLA
MDQKFGLMLHVCVFLVAFARLSIWPSFHVALSNGSVFVDFSTKSNSSIVSNLSLSLVDMGTNATLLTRTLPSNQPVGRVEFNCSCFLYAGTFRFLLRQTSITPAFHANETDGVSVESLTWWWSSELQVQWPTFHIAVERAANRSDSFQVGISMNEHFQACSSSIKDVLLLEVTYMEYNQIGRNSIDKIRARVQRPIKALRSQIIEFSCAFPFTEKDFIRVTLRSPHTAQEVKSTEPLYLSRIFFYKLLVENANAYKNGCVGTMTVKMITPPCAHISGKVLLYSDAPGKRAEESSSPPLAFNWLTQGENETEFNCSVFHPGKSKYCFRFVFNFSRSLKQWGPWQPWSVCSASCGEAVRERVRECLLPSGVRGLQCSGMIKEQSLCSLEDCVVSPSPSPSPPPVPVGVSFLGGNMIVVLGISLCLSVIMATVVVTVWRRFCQTPQCSSVRRGSIHSPGGRKLSDEASICGHSLQRPSLSDCPGSSGGVAVPADANYRGSQPLSQKMVLPPLYKLAQQQLKEMKKKGLKEATQLYHVSSSPVHDTVAEKSPNTDWVEMNPTFRRTSSFSDTKFYAASSAQSRHFRERSMTQVRNTYRSDQKKTWLQSAVSSHNPERKHTGTNTNSLRASENVDFCGTGERKKGGEPADGSRDSNSGIGGPASKPTKSHGTNHLSVDQVERAEQNWNRRGPSPIQRNILARKLKEAQSCSGARACKRSSSFNVSSSEQRKSRCRSLPISEDHSGGSPYRLSEAEQRMLDLDLSPVFVQEEE